MSIEIKLNNNSNLTNFIKGKRVKLISDFEGKISKKLFQQEIFLMRDKLERFIYCGDIADYTGNIDITKKDRYKFLQFIKFINDNKIRFSYVLGNRDFNKIQLLQLLVFNDQDHKWWKGDPSEPINILEISDSLLSINNAFQKDKAMWLVEDLTSFYPFWWSANISIMDWKGWQSAKRKLSLYERYLAIFGFSPKDGIMNAQNTIIGVAIELNVLTEEIGKYIREINVPFQERTPDFFNAADRLAALVFTVYARMLDPELAGDGKKWEYDGSLYKYLINGNIVSYAFDNNDESDSTKLYLFSHGGVHSNFKKNLLDFNIKKSKYWQAINEQKELFISQQKQTGGQIDTINDLEIFNTTICASINACFDEFRGKYRDNSISDQLKFTLSISSGCGPFYNDDLKKKGTNNFKDIENCHNGMSTILSGFNLIFNDRNQLLIGQKPLEIYNIFGHEPLGLGYIFTISQNNSNIVSTDFSNSFLNSNFTDFDNNTFILVLQNNTFLLEGEIYFNLGNIEENDNIFAEDVKDFYIITGQNPEDVTEFKQLLLESNKNFYITFNSSPPVVFDKQQQIADLFSIEKTKLNGKFNYNGTGKLNDPKTGKLTNFTVDIFSLIKEKFKINLALFISKVQVPLMGGKRKSKIHKKLKNKSTNKLSTKTKKYTNQSKKHKKNNLQQNKKKSKKF